MTKLEYHAWRSKVRRNELADAKLCINGALHGEATHGVRCAWCHAVHKFGAVVAFSMGVPRPFMHGIKRFKSAGSK